MAVDPITQALSLGQSVIERIWPDANKRAEEMRKLQELAQAGDLARLNAEVQLMLGQLEVNKVEADHKSIFVAGWRPAVGWVCVTILSFNYIGVYLLEYLAAILPFLDSETLPARFDMAELWPMLLGMLGIGGMRSFDKSKGTQTDKI